MDRDSRSRRYDDGEVTRYGAGESYRPFNDRTPRRARSPARDRARSPPLRERERARSPPVDSDRYVPDRTPRRRSRSADRYRRDRSRDNRDRERDRDRDRGRDGDRGDSWRRRDRTRSPPRRASPPRRNSPPRRYSPRRDGRDDRDRDRARSPRRGYDSRIRSRSPRRDVRERDRRSPPPRRASPPARGSNYRRRSPSVDRRDDRYNVSSYRRPSPPRESAVTSAVPSGNTSRRSSPRPTSVRRDDRSFPQSPIPSRPLSRSSHDATKDRSPARAPPPPDSAPAAVKSPPRGPAALTRAPPTGPREARDGRNFAGQSVTAIGPPTRPTQAPAAASIRQDVPSSGAPPSGPRGYVPCRGGYGRGGRGGGWGASLQSRNLPACNGPASTATTGTNSIPTGPRVAPTSSSTPSTPVAQSKPFNPPKGPAADLAIKRPSFAEQLLATLPPIIPGGKIDPAQVPLHTGVLPELQSHFNQLKEEEEKIRQDVSIKQEKLRKSLALWDKLERESKVLELRSNLSEQSLAKVSGDGVGGAAF